MILLTVALLVALSPFTWLISQGLQQDLYTEHDRHGHDTARLVARWLAGDVAGRDADSLDSSLQDLIRHSDVVSARVENLAGNILAAAGTPASDIANASGFDEEIHYHGEAVGRVTLTLSTDQLAATLARRQRLACGWQLLAMFLVVTVGSAAIPKLILPPLSVGVAARALKLAPDGVNAAHRSLEPQAAAAGEHGHHADRRLETQSEERQELKHELDPRRLTDPLTGLPNQRFFEMLMDTEVERCVRNDETISILLIDVPDLAAVAGQAPHDGGELLCAIARVVADHTRASDIACRYDAFGFFVLCRRATIANAVARADDLQRNLAEQSFVVHGRAQRVAVRIGVATAPGAHRVTSAARLFDCAREALRHCQETGRSGVVHYAMIDRASRSASL